MADKPNGKIVETPQEATQAEKSTGEGGELNAVPTSSGIAATGASSRNAAPAPKAAEPELKYCKIDDPSCEACE